MLSAMLKAIHEKLLFLNQFLHAPKQIGSVTPSSVFLARKMIDTIPWDEITSIAELGTGTGSITRLIHSTMNKGTQLLLFEKESSLRERLVSHFPDASIYEDASRLQNALQIENITQLDCIVSGLPFFNFSPELRQLLIQQIVSSLKPGGMFVAFQYSNQMKRQLSKYFIIEHVHFVSMNLPPAFVYVCRKK